MNSETAAPLPPTRPFYWSVRREIWENRSLYIAPMAAAGVVLFGVVISAVHLPEGWHLLSTLNPDDQGDALTKPLSLAAIPVVITLLLVGAFYCLDALYGERRDRSILFWKSLPVSDTIVVLAKLAIPLVVLPLIGFAVILVMQLIIVILSTAVLLANGLDAAIVFTRPPWPQIPLVQLYALFGLALWYAPIYGWLLLVSAWARRAPFLWAILTPLGLCLGERIAFHTAYLGSALLFHLTGFLSVAFQPEGPQGDALDRLNQLDLPGLVGSPALWVGLAFTAACLAAAIVLRRYRGPI